MNIEEYISTIPKAELHVHIEGTFEPELMFSLAQRNRIKLKYNSIDELRKAYRFNNLQEFLDIYYEGANVLLHEKDFYDLTWAYMNKLHSQNVRHTEIFFDPQTHTDRMVDFSIVIDGINKALVDAKKKFGISSNLIMCFLRHLSEEKAFDTLENAIDYKDLIIGVGLDSSELGYPPSNFKNVFEKARKEGFKTVAHAGEEGPPEYVWEAINLLKVDRIDHGNRALEDKNLVKYLDDEQIPLTICPLSNLKLKVVNDLVGHPLKRMMEHNLLVTINSDDPAYFGGQLNDNYIQIAKALNLSKSEIRLLAVNSFNASFLHKNVKNKHIEAILKV